MIIAGIIIGVLSTVAAETVFFIYLGIYEERRSNRMPTKEEWKVM